MVSAAHFVFMNDSTIFDYDSFFSRANRRFMLSDGQRYGQFLMNYLQECHPEIVVPEEYDCFYDNHKVAQFLGYLSQLSA